MRVILQQVELEFITPNAVQLIERAGRTCYKSEDKITDESAAEFVRMLLKRGHESVIEHAHATFRVICDRGVSHEFVRHRIFSYCLAGDTEVISFKRKKGYRTKRWTLEQLYKWQSDPKRKGRLRLIRLRSVASNGVLVPGEIIQILETGKQEVFQVRSKSGRVIKATSRERFLTPTGYRRLQDMKVGDKLMVNGLPAWANREWIEQKYIHEQMTRSEVAALAGVSDSYLGQAIRRMEIKKPLSLRINRQPGHGVRGMHSIEGLAKLSESKRGKNNPAWKGEEVGPGGGRARAQKMYVADVCWGCGTTERVERHHCDGDAINNSPENVLLLCPVCHKSFHAGAAVLAVHSDEIVEITPAGVQQTYDLEMAGPHNFVANGFVVHNSQESTRYCNYSKSKFGNEITVIQVPLTKPEQSSAVWREANEMAERYYFKLLALGEPPEIARAVLMTDLKTELVGTANFREWRHFLRLRMSLKAHPQMREVAQKIGCILLRECRPVFEDVVTV